MMRGREKIKRNKGKEIWIGIKDGQADRENYRNVSVCRPSLYVSRFPFFYKLTTCAVIISTQN